MIINKSWPKSPTITWITRSTLDYRIPVFSELDKLCNNQLHLIISEKWTPNRVLDKIYNLLNDRAHILKGEIGFGYGKPSERMANQGIRVPYQPNLIKTIIDTKPDLIIGDGFFQWTYANLLVRIIKCIPLVICYERTHHTERNAQWYRTLYRKFIIRWIDAICCNGILSAEYTKWLGMPYNFITEGHMVADIKGIQDIIQNIDKNMINKLKESFNSKGIIFLFVGQLIKRKGVHQLLEAWCSFEDQKFGEGTLVIIGTGPEEKSLKMFVEDHSLKYVRFLGSVDYEKIPLYYSASDVFIMPTLEDNWSLVVPEAMACGLPILTSIYNGCWPELVNQTANGWFFDSLNTKDILRCLLNCVNSKNTLDLMGKLSLDIVTNYSAEKAAKEIYRAGELAAVRRYKSKI